MASVDLAQGRRYRLILRLALPAWSMGADPLATVERDVADLGFSDVRALRPEDVARAPEVAAELAELGAPFPSWLAVVDASWLREAAHGREDVGDVAIVRARDIGPASRSSPSPSSPGRGLALAAGVALFAVVAVWLSRR